MTNTPSELRELLCCSTKEATWIVIVKGTFDKLHLLKQINKQIQAHHPYTFTYIYLLRTTYSVPWKLPILLILQFLSMNLLSEHCLEVLSKHLKIKSFELRL